MRRNLVEKRFDRPPPGVADEVGISRLAVGRELLDRCCRRDESGAPELSQEELRRRRKSRRALDAVETGELPRGLEGRLAVDLSVDGRWNCVGPEGDVAILCGGGRGRRREQRKSCAPVTFQRSDAITLADE